MAANPELVEKQGLTPKDVEEIEQLHSKRKEIESKMSKSKDVSTLRKLFEEWTDNEFELQRTWKFKEDERYHRSWYLPHCICPKMDNNERIGHGMIINKNCPIHGGD
jgi:hypothetical protein